MPIQKISAIAVLALTGAILTSVCSPAKAIVITVSGTQYDVTTFTGSYNNNLSKFATAANGGVMPWYGSSTLADTFASAVGGAFGAVNGTNNGPGFAYNFVPGTGVLQSRFNVTNNVLSASNPFSPGANSTTVTYAQATPVPWETDTLPVVGSTVLFGFGVWAKSKSKSVLKQSS